MNLTTRNNSAWVPKSFDEKTNSCSVVAATEKPCEVYDFERYATVKEVLLIDGLVLPDSGQVPLLDSHNRNSVSNVLGSARNFQQKQGELHAQVFFSNDADGKNTALKVKDGHLTDFSVGYLVCEYYWVEEGEVKELNGSDFKGPLKVVTKWKLKELSITPIAADQNAKVRSSKEKQRGRNMQNGEIKKSKEEIRAETAERERCSEITAMCRNFNCSDIAAGLIDRGAPLAEANKAVLDHIIATSVTAGGIGYRGQFNFIADESNKRSEAIVDSLCLRAGLRLESPAPGSMEYRGLPLIDIAKECLSMNGVRVSGMSRSRIISTALTQRSHTTSDFPSLLANAANKILRTRYEEAPGSFSQWVNVTSGKDFKEMSRTQLSEAPDFDLVREDGEYTYGSFGESKEVFRIYKYGKLFSITREAIVNDDLSAFTRIPFAFAMSARRKVNAAVYSVLTNNAAMSDLIALFHADHSNFVAHSSGAAPSKTTLSAGRLAMRSQAGLNGSILNIAPKFLIVPAALETTSDELLNSLASVDDNKNSNVVNPFYKKLELVVEPILDQNDPAAWYMAADSKQIDTVELCFLDGRETPYLETRDGWTVDGVEFKVRIEFGTTAIDPRGLYKNDGN